MVPNHARYHLRYTPKQLYYYSGRVSACQEICEKILFSFFQFGIESHGIVGYTGTNQMKEVIGLTRSFQKWIAVLLLLISLVGIFSGCKKKQPQPTPVPTAAVQTANAETPSPETEPPAESEEPEESDEPALLDEKGSYTTKDDVALYIHQYGHLPDNFITKKEAQALGWSGGSLEPYAPGKSIGGSHFGNYEGLLPEGHNYTECDIDTMGKNGRGAKRIVFSDDGLIFYTDDHYESFTQLYGEGSQ